MNKQDVMFEEFVEGFKIMLVRRYQWSVTKASQYKDEDGSLKRAYEEGLSIQEAYYRVFKIKQDLVEG